MVRFTRPHRETVEDQIHRIIPNLESELLQLFQVNFVEDDTDLYRDSYMLKGILDRCAFPSYYISDVHADALEMPQALQHYITGLLQSVLRDRTAGPSLRSKQSIIIVTR
jgi:hypothetical protein